MAAVPIYVWNGTAWQETGPTIPASPIKYQASAPTSPSTGDIWVDSDADVTTGSQQFQRFRFVASAITTVNPDDDPWLHGSLSKTQEFLEGLWAEGYFD